MTVPFISRTDLGVYMGQDLTAAAAATIAIDAACEAIRTYTRRELNYVEDDVILLDGTGHETLSLPEWPIIGDVVVEVDDVAYTDFVVQESRLVRTDGGWWPWGVSNIAVTYSHGYAVTEADVDPDGPERMPSDLRDVALTLAGGLMSVSETRFRVQSPRDSVGGSNPVEGPGPAVITEQQRQLLKRYQDFRVG